MHDAKYAGSSRAAECTLLIALDNSPASVASTALNAARSGANALNLSKTQVLANAEVAVIWAALGLAPTYCLGPDKSMSISGLRYGRVVVLADGDCDGIYKTALLMDLIMASWPFLLNVRGLLSSLPRSKLPARTDIPTKFVSLGSSLGNRLSSHLLLQSPTPVLPA